MNILCVGSGGTFNKKFDQRYFSFIESFNILSLPPHLPKQIILM